MRVFAPVCDNQLKGSPVAIFPNLRLLDPARGAEATNEPEHHKNEHDNAKNAAESSAAVAAVRVVSTATAEQKNQHYYDQNAHYRPSLQIAPEVWSISYFFSASRTVSFMPPMAF
jgi:hypothetical protein